MLAIAGGIILGVLGLWAIGIALCVMHEALSRMCSGLETLARMSWQDWRALGRQNPGGMVFGSLWLIVLVVAAVRSLW